MRTFVALPIPERIRAIIGDAIAGPRKHLPPSRWVPIENLHLTIRFLGEVEEANIGELQRSLRHAFRQGEALTLQIGGGGCFPKRRPGRVAWLGFTESSVLESLSRNVFAATDPFVDDQRSKAEGYRFFPHITVARPRKPWPRAAVGEWQRALPGPIGPSFVMEAGVLMHSRLGAGGARYDVSCKLPLGTS